MTEPKGKPARKVELTVEINAPVEAVWKALADGEELTRWFPLDARVTPGAGGSVWMSWGAPWEGEAKIEIWEPNRHLRTVEPPPKPESIPVVFDYYLESRGGKTILRLVQSFGTGQDWEDEYYESVSRGWPFMLANLRHYLEIHPGTPRQVAWPRLDVTDSPDVIWKRLLSADGFLRQGSLADLEPGDSYSIETAAGDRLQGKLLFMRMPWSFCLTVDNLNNALLWVNHFGIPPEKVLKHKTQIWVWLSAYGLPPAEVEAFNQRWQQRLEALFPEGKKP